MPSWVSTDLRFISLRSVGSGWLPGGPLSPVPSTLSCLDCVWSLRLDLDCVWSLRLLAPHSRAVNSARPHAPILHITVTCMVGTGALAQKLLEQSRSPIVDTPALPTG